MTSVSNYARARRGMVASGTFPGDTQQLTAAINAGTLVTRLNATEGKVKAPATAAECAALAGALRYDSSWCKKTEAQTTDFAADEIVEVVDKGPIYLQAENAMTRGTTPYVRYATGAGGTELGVLRNASVASETAPALGVRVLETTTGQGPVLCEVNLPSTG